MYFRHISAKM